MEIRLKDAEEQKVSLKKQIETFMNDEHTASGEAAKSIHPHNYKLIEIQRSLREEIERHQNEVNSLQRQINQLTTDLKEGRQLTHDLETEITTLNEELRTAKRVEDSLNSELRELRQKLINGNRDSEYLRKLQSENSEFQLQITTVQNRLDDVSEQRDRLTKEMSALQDQLNSTERIEAEFGSVRAEKG